ncbi:MAG: T9SS type A sorting domain-containing protein, partial [Chitinophagaceae bacterium]
LTPNGTGGFCTGGNIALTATSNPAYIYTWKKNGGTIPGAASNIYTANTAGTYEVTVTSGACSGVKSVVISEVAAPTAAIATGGAATFCEGGSVTLDANIGASYSYQWYKNGTLITGATAATYAATATGNYTVKVSAGASCEATSSAVSVTVNTTPAAAVTTTGSTGFCSGGSLLLTASSGTGYSYQWYRNTILITGAINGTYTATTSGSYTVTVMLGTCPRTSAATIATVLPSPSVAVTPVSSTIQKFQTQTLTGTGAATYNWSSLPDMVSNTATSAIYRPLTTHTYTVEGTAANGCKSLASATITVIGCGDVTNIATTSFSPSRVNITWVNPQDVTTDSLQYRKVGEATWHKIFVTGQAYELNGLEPNTNYEYNVIPLCTTTTVFIPSAVGTFKTQALENGIYVRLFPNPVAGTSRLEIISASNYSLSASIYDNGGKLVRVISSAENLPAGQIIKTIGAEKLANGVYHILIYINGKAQDIKMMIAR